MSRFRLTHPVNRSEEESNSIDGLQVLGLAVNPRHREPLLVVSDGAFVSIRSLKEKTPLERHGQGFFDLDEMGKSVEAQRETGFPRSHTPDGVFPRRKGYGTSLYSALSIAASMEHEGIAKIDLSQSGSGICSVTGGRSIEADAWWQAALDRRLTTRVSVGGSDDDDEYEYEDYDFSDERITAAFDVDIFPFSSVIGHHLCAGVFVAAKYKVEFKGATPDQELNGLMEIIQEDEIQIYEGFYDALIALDVRGLHRAAIYMLAAFYQESGLSAAARSALYYRWEHGLDPDSPIHQQQLFASNGAGDLGEVAAARRRVGWSELSVLP